MQLEIFGVTLVVSFVLYATMRRLDVSSTKEFAKYVDMQKHELNPLVNGLLRRGWTLDCVLWAMLFLFGIPIVLLDAYLNTYVLVGVPLFAFSFGAFHVVAAANNYGFLERVKKMSPADIKEEEEDNFSFAKEFTAAGWKKKVLLLSRRDTFSTGMTAIFLFGFGLLYYSIGVAGLGNLELVVLAKGYPVYSFFNMGWILVVVMGAYYPLRTIGSLVMARRYSKMAKLGAVTPYEGKTGSWMDVTVDQLRDALKIAEDNKTRTVRLWVGAPSGPGGVVNG